MNHKESLREFFGDIGSSQIVDMKFVRVILVNDDATF